MGLRRKPHVFVHTPVRNTSSGGRVDVPAEQAGRAIKCQITPLTASSLVNTWGDVKINAPHLMMCDVADGETITKGDRGIYDGLEYTVKEQPMLFKAGRITDHAQVLLEQKQYR